MSIRRKQPRRPSVRNRNPHQGKAVPPSPERTINLQHLIPGGRSLNLSMRGLAQHQIETLTKVIKEAELNFIKLQREASYAVWPDLTIDDVKVVLGASINLIQGGCSQLTPNDIFGINFLRYVIEHTPELSNEGLDALTNQDKVDQFAEHFRASCKSMYEMVNLSGMDGVMQIPVEAQATDQAAQVPDAKVEVLDATHVIELAEGSSPIVVDAPKVEDLSLVKDNLLAGVHAQEAGQPFFNAAATDAQPITLYDNVMGTDLPDTGASSIYGTSLSSAEAKWDPATSPIGVSHQASFSGLQPGTKYEHTVIGSGVVTGDTLTAPDGTKIMADVASQMSGVVSPDAP